MKRQSETALSAEIVKALRKKGHWVLRLPAGKIQRGPGRWVHIGEKGMPDIFVVDKNIWLEVKLPGGKLSPDQEAWHRRAHLITTVHVVHSIEEALAVVSS